MGKGRRNITFPVKEKGQAQTTGNMSDTARNLRKDKLGAVIFGCKNHTITECLDKKIFGLPGSHYSYVKNVTPGLTLYLFNYSDRKLHGVFEAVSTGQRNIDPHGWANEGVEFTSYPSQVRVRERSKCRPLLEEEFKPIIASNYYTERLFWFELDRDQNRRLMKLFLPSSLPKKVPRLPRKPIECFSSSIVDKNAFEVFMCGDSEECSGVADVKLREEDSCTPFGYNDSLDTEKNWSYSASSCVLTNEENVKYQKVELKSKMTECSDNEWKLAPSSEGWSIPSPEASLNDSDPRVSGSWEDNAFMDNSVEEIYENKIQYPQCQDSDSGEYERELDSLLAEGKYLFDMQEIARSETDVSIIENCERNRDQFNLTNKAFQEDKNDMPAVVQTDAQSSQYMITKLMQEVGMLKLSQVKQTLRIHSLEHELVNLKVEIDQLKSICKFDSILASTRINCNKEDSASPNLKPEQSVFIVGGFDGCSWLSDLSLYSPSKDHVVSLCPMTFTRSHASFAKLNGELYIFGGARDGVWYDIVESYNPFNNRWIQRPCLNRKKGCMAGASMHETIFAVGGGNGAECFSEVELFDLHIGSWLSTQPMLEKRSAPAAADLNGALYVAGGFDGIDYLRSFERFDPRQHAWTNLSGMNLKRGCHSLVAFNEKLYALGGYDGDTMVSSVEVFDPRIDSWMMAEPMKASRGYFGSFVLGGRIYIIGGLHDSQVLDKVEWYDEDSGWHESSMKAVGKRSFLSALLW